MPDLQCTELHRALHTTLDCTGEEVCAVWGQAHYCGLMSGPEGRREEGGRRREEGRMDGWRVVAGLDSPCLLVNLGLKSPT